MAMRTKTIEVPFPANLTGVLAATRFDFSAVTIYLPENVSRTFKSVALCLTVSDNYTVAANMTSFLLGIKLGAAAFNDNTITETLSGTGGEHQTWTFVRDVTSYFNTNFGSGTSQTCQVGTQFGGAATINHVAKLIITYEYDDSTTTRVKTVKIPLESNLANLPTSLGSIGTNQVPALDSFLPESSKVYRHIWFEVFGNCNSNSTADYQLSYALDGEAAVPRALKTNNLNSGIWYNDCWVRTGTIDTSVAHDFKAMCSVASRFYALAVVMHVTYEYDESASTSIINSLEFDLASTSGRFNTTTGDASKDLISLLINEPGPISLKQSGLVSAFGMVSNTTVNMSVGSQAYRTYAVSPSSVVSGQNNFIQRVDSGSAVGAAFSLARGMNSISAMWYASTTNAGFLQGYMLLNYTSGKSTRGAASHNQTRKQVLGQSDIFDTQRYTSAAAFSPSQSNYFISVLHVACRQYINGNTAMVVFAECLAGEWQGGGWIQFYGGLVQKDASNGVFHSTFGATQVFKQFPLDPRTSSRVDFATARRYRMGSQNNVMQAFLGVSTYTSNYFESVISLTGYTGDGSGITVNLFRESDGLRVWTGTTGVGGTVTAVWYDDTQSLVAEAIQDSTRHGCSEAFYIGTNETIALLPGSSPAITFAGIVSLTALGNGALRASWAAASGGTAPLRYEVYIQANTVTGLFSDANRVEFPADTTIDLFQLANGDYLTLGTTYYVGVRACDFFSCDTNTVSLSAVSLGVIAQSLEETANLLKQSIVALANIRIATATDIETDLVETDFESDLVQVDSEIDLVQSDSEIDLVQSDMDTQLVSTDIESDLLVTDLEIDSMESDMNVGC